MMYQRMVKLGSCRIGIYSEKQLKTEKETEVFTEAVTEEEPIYKYVLQKTNKIEMPRDIPCLKWGQWWIFDPGGDEKHIRITDDEGVPYMCYSRTGERTFQIVYLEAIEPHLGINRFTLSFMALEQRMLEQQGLILHCSFVEYQGYGILFSAPSGTGKSTQADLWEKYRPCRIINGDRALIQKQEEGFFVYGWPVCGSSCISDNTCVPIKAIVQLSQGETNCICEENKGEQMQKLIPEVTVNRWNVESYTKALDIMEEILDQIKIVHYRCNISEDAVDCLEQYLFYGEN